ncbi:MAG: hypothetical protein QGG24_00085 [Vicinamibacterales bacterium]|jgi:adenylylsulfate reductase subunit B|nr:4Fe-4S ferredoxin [Acidobacteriota bacterium]MDP7293694.1 hypothetical protein [Vicinamibacterales bacterium]MDP7473103.1 hypothetical protein [Vicinamibacterales bacterium]MDP7671341.1 hypothetical protein [Vicinamibacterales bacterium]|tara:strand:- start:6937 stop:7155 length:219 start_codon:yes stop_codon:yes gene_type:complete
MADQLTDGPQIGDTCVGCVVCVDLCPGDVLRMEGDKAVVEYADECWWCGVCRVECPVEGCVQFKFPVAMMKG